MRFSKLNCHSGCPIGTGGEISVQITKPTSQVSAAACRYGNSLWKEGMMSSKAEGKWTTG